MSALLFNYSVLISKMILYDDQLKIYNRYSLIVNTYFLRSRAYYHKSFKNKKKTIVDHNNICIGPQ